LGDGRALLTDGDINAIEFLRFITAGVDRLLVQDGVDRNRRLAGLAVADDELALATADGHQSVDGLEAGLHRLMHRAARNDARSLDLDALAIDVRHRALAVDGIAQPIHHAAEQASAHGHIAYRPRAPHPTASPDRVAVAETDQ